MSKTIHRIMDLVHALGMSARKFDKSIGTGNGYTLRMHKNNASVGSDVIEKIKEVYPQTSLVWLITGKGPMFIFDDSAQLKSMDNKIQKLIYKKFNQRLEKERDALMVEIMNELMSMDKINN